MNPEIAEIDIVDFRACSAGETFQRVSPVFSRLGITRVARQTSLDRIGVPVWCAYTPNAKAIVIAQGKGLDDEAARTSAAMEAVERAVAANPACKTRSATPQLLRRSGQSLNSLDSLLSIRMAPIRDDELVTWTKAENLLTRDETWLPFEAVQLDRTLISPRFWQSSDGLASGNTCVEATLHGLLERVERDAITLWQVTSPTKRHRQRIDTAEISNPGLCDLLGKLSAAELDLALFNITSDLAIPCVVALIKPKHQPSTRNNLRHVDITLGAGASVFPEVAAMRAITEAIQSRMTFIAGARDDVLPETFLKPADPVILAAFDTAVSRQLAELPRLNATSTSHALEMVLKRLQSHGITEIYVVDLSPDWLPASVVKVIVPQLENPDGGRRLRFGSRAISRALQ
jgi:ribosomal protein S12 methylthiotransferase accessory factor